MATEGQAILPVSDLRSSIRLKINSQVQDYEMKYFLAILWNANPYFLVNHLQCCIVDTPLFVKMHILRLISSVWDFWARSSGCCLTIMLYSQLLHSSLFGLNLPTNTHGDGESPCQKRLQIYNTLNKYALQLLQWHLLDQIRHLRYGKVKEVAIKFLRNFKSEALTEIAFVF